MKGEPQKPMKKSRNKWIIDESKCLGHNEVTLLRTAAVERLTFGKKSHKLNFIRDWFMVELGLNTGLRVAEMASLRHQDVYIDGDRSSVTVVGKGGKKRAIWISSNFKQICIAYTEFKQRLGLSTDRDSFLLNPAQGGGISKRSLQKAFKNLLSKAKLPSHYSIHCLRHTYSTFLLRASANNYRFTQQQLGHSSIRTTQVYASVVESDARRALEKLYTNP